MGIDRIVDDELSGELTAEQITDDGSAEAVTEVGPPETVTHDGPTQPMTDAGPAGPATDDEVGGPIADAVLATPAATEVVEAAVLLESDEPPAGVDREPPDEPEPSATPLEPRTVGRYIGDSLRAAGVRYAFTVPGESFLGLLEGIDAAGIRIVTTRHEGGAAFMAEAHGQLTGRPAIAMGTRAVGAANLSIGIHTARQDSTPLFALVGQVERGFIGREAFQEVDQPNTFGRLAKWAAELTDVDRLPSIVGEAIRAALGGRPGPVLLSLPEDLLDAMVPGEATEVSRPLSPRPDPDDVHAVLQLLACAERPVIVAGAGVLRARTSSDLVRLAEMLEVPVIASWRRADVISNDHQLYLGMAGYGAPDTVRDRLANADAVLVLGCRLNEPTSYGYTIPAAGTPWAHVDLAPRSTTAAGPGGLAPPAISVASDARAFIRAAVVRLRGAALDAGKVDARRANNAADRAAWEAATAVPDHGWTGPGVDPARSVATLRRVLPDEAVIATDAGNFGLWIARHFRFRRPGTFLGPTSGAMGYGLPAAIAAALIHRDRPVVAVAGDGGFAMTMNELETAVREGARVIAVVFDNERYGTIRMHQDQRGSGQGVATELGPIDFAAVARACGARGVRVDDDDGFEPALLEALASDQSTVLQLRLDRRWVSPTQPPT